MKRSRNFKSLAKSGAARSLALMAAVLLILEPFALALEYKYPTSYTITPVPMGSNMTLEQGVVFGFNSAKSMADADAYADLQEAACKTPLTNFTFGTGMEGFSTVAGAKISYNYSGSEGNGAPPGAINTRLSRSNTSSNFQWNKTFFWDCGTPSAATFSLYYKRGTWTSAGLTNNFQVNIVKPDLVTVVPVVASTDITATGWTQVTGTIADPAGTFNQPGTYTLRINGTLSGTSNSATNVIVHFDDVNLTVSSAFATFKQETEMEIHATPYSSLPSNQYLLDIRARQNAADSENTYIQVWNGATWTTRYTVSSPVWTVFDTYYLTPAEYNNGNVRVRYVDADQSAGDTTTQGGVQVEYQRVGVDLGTCVDQVTDQEADCGKCHNYNGDITKPWPSVGMHNKHAQTESISDCLWCHPDNGTNSAHRNGTQGGYAIELGGTKVYRSGQTPTAAGSYDSATKRCSNVACHMGNTTPRWDSTYGLTQGALNDATGVIARNCSRCHNSGTPGPDTYSGPSGNYSPNITDFNLNVAWPSTGDGGGHASHNAAFRIDDFSCQTNGSCHPDNTGQHSVVDDAAGTVVKMSPSYASPNQIVKYIPDTTNGTGTCANVSCHGGQQTPRFNTANTPPGIGPIDVTNATGCVKCHTPEGANGWGTAPGNASQYNAPISGLHRGSPPTSTKNHVSDYSCTRCHQPSPASHFKAAGGGTNLHTPGMDPIVAATDLVTGATGVGNFTAGIGTSPNYTTPPTCATPAGTAGCHAEADLTYRNPATSWSRKWSWDAYDTATPVNQCKNCHGHWGSFSAGVVEPHVTSNSDLTLRSTLITSHSENGNDCATMCHAQTNGAYNHGAAVGATKDMTVNSNANFVDNGTVVGCTFCHLADGAAPDGGNGTNHVFADATWVTAQSIAGPTPNCANDVAGCHGNTAGNKYWPDGTVTYPDKAGEHDMHMTKLAAKLYTENLAQLVTNTGNGTADAKQKAICVYCHNTLSPGLPGHTSDATATQAEVSSFKRIWDGAADTATAGTFATADGSCSNVDCHNNKATTTTYGWRAGATSACLMCHNSDGSGTNNPTTGLHFGTLTVSANTHDDNFQVTKGGASTGTCITCHTTTPSSAHINGTFNNSPSAVAAIITFDGPVGFADNATAPTCTPNGALATCHTDAGTWSRKWSTTAKNNSAGAGGTECDNCHGGFVAGTDWTFGSDNAVGDYNVSHARDWDLTTPNEIYGNHSNNTAYTNKCNICHVYGDAPYTAANFATYHNNGKVTMNTMNGTNTYDGTTNYNCTNTCHDNNTNHRLEPSSSVAAGTRLEMVAGPALTCTGCHGGATPKAGVSSSSSHVIRGNKAGYNTFNACTDCHPGGGVGSQHSATGVVNIANNATVGINYVNGVNGYTGSNGIVLGGNATTGATEAEICWNCHNNMTYQATAISEWGLNSDTNGTAGNYNFGDIYTTSGATVKTPNWVGAWWKSATAAFSYKTGRIQSTHSVNSSGVSGVDTVTNIRCSYCHNVHNGTNGTVATKGKPFLRGSWMGSPYLEDGAPQSGTTYPTSATNHGSVPRATNANNTLGGYQIDQNNSNPTTGGSPAHTTAVNATWTLTNSAGLCVLCHTSNVNTMNQFGVTADAWVGSNGHANAAIGGTGTGAANIFTMSGTTGTGNSIIDGRFAAAGTAALYSANGGNRGAPRPSYTNAGAITVDTTVTGDGSGSFYGYGFRSQNGSGFMLTPQVSGTRPYAYQGYNWGANVDDSAAQVLYHKFSCSKCHNPHASRLPRLMVTNCLDTKQNTWDDALSTSGTTGAGYSTENATAKISQWTSAQNCHRLKNTAQGAGARGRGWNRVTPWTTEGTQDNGVIP